MLIKGYMQKIIKLMSVAGLVCALTACGEDQNNYQYLVTHPAVMKKKMDACAVMTKTASNVEKQHCEIVLNASTKFMAVVAEQQTDAEKFGVRVLNAQTTYANTKAKVKQLENDITKAKAAGTPDIAALHKLEADLVTAKNDCDAQRLEVRMLLAVVGVSTPN
jgi:hypothetical protein